MAAMNWPESLELKNSFGARLESEVTETKKVKDCCLDTGWLDLQSSTIELPPVLEVSESFGPELMFSTTSANRPMMCTDAEHSKEQSDHAAHLLDKWNVILKN